MPYDIDTEPVIITVPAQATAPVNDIPAPEWVDLKNRVAAVEGLGLVDLSDVDLTDIDEGMLLGWDAGDELWRPVNPTPAGLDYVRDWQGNHVMAPVRRLQFSRTLTAVPHGSIPGMIVVIPNVGTAANTLAAGDHVHTQPLPVRVTTAPSGYISGGSQPLGSTAVTLPSGIACVVEAELYGQFRGADSGAAYYTVSITIAGNTYTSPGGESGFWCVQGVPDKIQWQHERRMTGTGSAVPVSASVAWHSGSGFNIDRTYLKVRVRPDR